MVRVRTGALLAGTSWAELGKRELNCPQTWPHLLPEWTEVALLCFKPKPLVKQWWWRKSPGQPGRIGGHV